MIGAAVAKGLALGQGKPYLGINHLEGHLLSPFFGDEAGLRPAVGLVVSGGHTLLVDIAGFRQYRRLGGTLDDAAGEAFDKVGKLLGLPYPGGPQIDRLARGGDPGRFDLPRSMLGSGDFSLQLQRIEDRRALPAAEDRAGDQAARARNRNSWRTCARRSSRRWWTCWCARRCARRRRRAGGWSR